MPARSKAALKKKAAYQKAYNHRRYWTDAKYRQMVLDKAKKRHKKCKAALEPIMQAFRGGGCLVCGEKEPCCLVAHHRDPRKKRHEIAQLFRASFNVDRIGKILKRELKKCVCLCHNCHSKVHAGVTFLEDHY